MVPAIVTEYAGVIADLGLPSLATPNQLSPQHPQQHTPKSAIPPGLEQCKTSMQGRGCIYFAAEAKSMHHGSCIWTTRKRLGHVKHTNMHTERTHFCRDCQWWHACRPAQCCVRIDDASTTKIPLEDCISRRGWRQISSRYDVMMERHHTQL